MYVFYHPLLKLYKQKVDVNVWSVRASSLQAPSVYNALHITCRYASDSRTPPGRCCLALDACLGFWMEALGLHAGSPVHALLIEALARYLRDYGMPERCRGLFGY